MDIVEKIEDMLITEKSDADKLTRWGHTFGKTHGTYPDEKGFHELCVLHMEDNVEDAPAYCARVKDVYNQSTYWRGKGKSKKEVESDVKAHQNVKISKEAKADISKK